jgi:hypothetical protein
LCYKVGLRDFWKVKLPGVWKIGHIPSDYRSGHEGKCLGKEYRYRQLVITCGLGSPENQPVLPITQSIRINYLTYIPFNILYVLQMKEEKIITASIFKMLTVYIRLYLLI